MKYKLGIIGIGVMGQAILNAIVNQNIVSNKEIALFDISHEKLMQFNEFAKFNSANELIQNSHYILIAVKPQNFKELSEDINCTDDNIIISIMAGLKISSIRALLNSNCGIARIMPNTPCKIGCGISAISYSNITKEQQDFIRAIFKACGEVIDIDESQFDAITSVSGSGPAYVYTFIDAMIKGGIDGGLSYDESKKLTIQTIIGTAQLALNSDDDMDILIDRVCSKGGTTIEAIDFFKKNGLTKIIRDGMLACKNKSESMGKLL